MTVRVLTGDCREILATMPDESVHCVVTSPPYWGLRCYGVDGQLGQEKTPEEHVAVMVDVFRHVRRVLRKDGTLWLNYGDCYNSGTAATRKSSHHNDVGYWQAAGTMGDQRVNVPGLKPKDLVMMPARIALALQADGWWLRSEIVWAKPNPMPESITDRPTSSHEKMFLLARSARYFYDAEAVRTPVTQSTIDRLAQNDGNPNWNGNRERTSTQSPQTLDITKMMRGGPEAAVRAKRDKQARWTNEVDYQNQADIGMGANLRNVWHIATHPYPDAHFATFPPALVEPCIKAGCPEGGTVLDPFGGSGTVGLVADRLGRDAILIELNPEYADMARARITDDAPLFAEVGT